ncbi:MAG TPA: homoserine kinase [Pyrinomonadaceae bacterium]|nr:homoserine kinase [Pyrinomonadaceae bacterium]
MSEVTVRAPASVSNVVVGFDCLGFALEMPYDEVTVRIIDEPAIRIVHNDDFDLPTEPDQNVAGVALNALIASAELDHGFEVEITKNIMPGSGIGSSAASSCAAVVAANHLIGDRFTKHELTDLAMFGEALASGSRHADNLAPCIYGGIVLVRSIEPLDVVEIEHPPLWATVVHPQIEVKTSEARAILPQQVPLKDAVKNWSNLGAFVAALKSGDYDLMARSMEDTIVEPARKNLIPNFDAIKATSLEAGAIGGGISGSGPSMFMLSDDPTTADEVADAMEAVFANSGIERNIYVSPISQNGVTVV